MTLEFYLFIAVRILLQMESKLLSQSGKATSRLMELEFVEASDTILPVTNDKLRRSLYKEAEAYLLDKDGNSDGVPIQRLSRILKSNQVYLLTTANVGYSLPFIQ